MKKNNSLLITILGGVIFCFVFFGIVLLFPSNNENNELPLSTFPNADEHGYVEEDGEISLGDDAGCIEWNQNCTCSSGTLSNKRCYQSAYSAAPGTCNTGWSYSNGQCHDATGTPANCVNTTCKTCKNDYDLIDGSCELKKHCYCNPDKTACVWSSTGDAVHNNIVSSITNQNSCQGQTVKTCCYNNGSGYSLGNVAASNCVGYPNSIITDAATCNAKNECTDSSKPYRMGDECVACDGANQYKVNNTCISCSSPYKTDASHNGKCYINVPAGSHLTSSLGTERCAKGTYSAGGVYYKDNGDQSLLSCTSCATNKTTLGVGATSVNQCVVDCGTLAETECKNQTHCAWNEATNHCDEAEQDISIVGGGGTAYVTPQVCKTYSLRLVFSGGTSATGAITWNVSGDDGHICSGSTCTVTVCGKGCYSNPSVTVTAELNGKTAETKIGRAKYREWDDTAWNKPATDANKAYNYNGKFDNGSQNLYTDSSLNQNVCYGYSGASVVDGVTVYEKKWYRCCGGGTPTAPHCYVDNEGKYHWTTSPEPSWLIKTEITKEKDCKEEETPACYIKPDGEYIWGKYATTSGYTLVTAITTSDACKAPTDEACYKKDNDYQWTSTQPEGYTKVEGVVNPADCGPEETPACYLHDNDFIWGKYEKITGYIYVEDITEESNCKKPDNDACYIDPNGDYVWGQYGDNEDYTLVPSVTDISQCKNDIPVPKTDINVSKIIYIVVAIMMAVGIGFIYYSTTIKKNS